MLACAKMPAPLALANPSEIEAFEASVSRTLSGMRTVEAAAQAFSRAIFEGFAHCVLARVYLTIPFRDLPDEQRLFVRDLAIGHGAFNRLHRDTVVLSLMGTWGTETQWRDRRKSRGHLGIPLLDPAFVQSIPMVSRLFEEMGVGVDLFGLDHAAYVRKLAGGFNGVFYVGDAAGARDSRNRHIIPAQEFVEEHAIKTVFGMGGAYLGGAMVACIVFAEQPVPRLQAERFATLVTPFKAATASLVRRRLLFDRG
ncbi:MAG: hypothetical protein NVSMB23_19530 [Myxococcales bacterium]